MTRAQFSTTAIVLLVGCVIGYQARTESANQFRINKSLEALKRAQKIEEDLRKKRDAMLLEQDLSTSLNEGSDPKDSKPIAPVVFDANPSPHRLGEVIFSAVDGSISSSFASAFNLTEEDQRALKTAIASARLHISNHLAVDSTLMTSTSTSLIINIPALPEGESVRLELLRAFENVLGLDKYAIFEAHYADDLERSDLGDFGKSDRRVTIVRTSNAFRIMDAKLASDKETSQVVVIPSLSALPTQYQGILQRYNETLTSMPSVSN